MGDEHEQIRHCVNCGDVIRPYVNDKGWLVMGCPSCNGEH